ncbi:MAG: alpha-L-glutamate ligase [Proteobacteria bacterium]|nr:alpha-L-glutamate ligase [Pseudomonadota bacterium]MBI3499845.1 alpha-L-glutamate ligase [Pseudomonadota bacterium]
MDKIYVLHENAEWVKPLKAAFQSIGAPYEEWFLDQGILDLRHAPPAGVFYNRMSASSHTRDHRYAAEYTGTVLAWLERHGRTVANSGRALQLEISKVAQYQALSRHGIATPDTLAVVGRDNIPAAADRLGYPLILKHNRGGKGLGVRLFLSRAALDEYLAGEGDPAPVDGITLVQRYIEAPEPSITRVEFVGGRFLYAVRVDTSSGFELCPADACQIAPANCPTVAPADRFRIIEGFDSPLIGRYQEFLAANGIHIAGVEFIRDKDGRAYTYDVNTNTNYNPDAEALVGVYGMVAIARYLEGLRVNQRIQAAA